MNIKKRLFLSNILMIVLPILLGFLVSFLFMRILSFQNIPAELVPGGQIPPNFSKEIWISGVIMASVIVVTVVALNIFSSQFVYRKINKSLITLGDGVKNIHEGNLDYRIVYRHNDEFKPICDNFNEMAMRLKSGVDQRIKDEDSRKVLIAGMSHDLRSPLTSIRMFAEGLLENIAVTQEAKEEYLKTIITKADEIAGKVNALFLFSKMDIGDYPYTPEKLDLKKAVIELTDATKTEYQEKGLTINIVSFDDDAFVYIDPMQFNSVFSNIIDNCQKYKSKDTVTVNITGQVLGEKVKIIFEDNGPGVSEDALPKLFDIFYRSDNARTNTHKGSGLGLAIVKKAIEKANGSIVADNMQSGGLKIIISIPKYTEENKEGAL